MDPWDTAISITNPGLGEETADGGLEFTFYRRTMRDELNLYYDNWTGSSPGSGLEADGLSLRGTPIRLLSQIPCGRPIGVKPSKGMSMSGLTTPAAPAWDG